VRSKKHLTVTIPPGVDDGTRVRIAGEGNTGIDGGPPGHLYVFLAVKPHAYFRRKDNDIYLNITINVAQAALGDEIQVPTLDGGETLAVPAGTQTGQSFTLKGKGVPGDRVCGNTHQSERRAEAVAAGPFQELG
jgi:molecular chaperone DnaJ